MKISDYCTYAPKSKIKAGDANPNGKYQFYASSPDKSRRCDEYLYDCKAIIMGTGGSATLHYYDGKFSTSTDCLTLIPNENIRAKYLYYFFLANMDVLEAGFKGAGLKHTNKGYIDNIEITKIPSLSSQDKIVNLFDELASIIEKERRQIVKLDNLIKARFVEMFSFVDSEQVKIAELVEQKIPTAKKDFESDTDIKYIDISSIDNRRNIVTGSTKYKMSNAPSRAQQHVQFGDILISTVRPNLKNVAMVSLDNDNLVASSGFCVLRPKKCTPEFLMSIVCSDNFTNAMINVVTGANYPAIKNSDILNYYAPLPSKGQQKQFSNFVAQVDKSKFALSNELAMCNFYVRLINDSITHSRIDLRMSE